MSFLPAGQHPIKITFIRDESKLRTNDKQDRISIGFLSSMIQQHRRKKHAITNSEDILITTTNISNQQQITNRNQQQLRSIEKQSWGKQKKCRLVSQSQHKRLLTNLIGDNWNRQKYSEDIDGKVWRNNKNKTSIVRAKLLHNQDEQRIERNRKLMAFHFRTFLSNKKKKNIQVEPVERKYMTTRVYDKIVKQSQKSNSIINKYDKSPKRQSRHYEQLIKYESDNELKLGSLPQKKLANKYKSLDTNLQLKNNKYNSFNFKWSNVNNNQKFVLN